MDIKQKNVPPEGESTIKRYTFLILTAIVLLTVGYGLYLVRGILPYVGYFAVGAALVLMTCGVVAGFVYIIRFIVKVDEHIIGEYGTALRNSFGQVTILAPMTPNQALIAKRGRKVTVTPVVPSIIEEIANGVITLGQLVMHMGYEETKGGLIPVIDKWPGTFGIAGRGRSGKTRRVLTIIIQAIMGRARVFICDPHASKDDSLARLLAPLAPWLTIACNDAEIVEASRYFLSEMENRVQELSDNKTPWLIIYDEWSRLMTTDKIDDDDKEILKHTVEHCSTEYAGFYGFAGIIGQTWTEEAAGGTAIRRSLHKAFIHQLNAEYAKFFLKGKWANKAEDLTSRQCLYRVDGQVKQIITHTVPDETATWFADWLMEFMPPEQLDGPAIQLRLGNATGTKQIAAPHTSTEPLLQEMSYLPEECVDNQELPYQENDTPEHVEVSPQIKERPISKDARELQQVVGAWDEGYRSIMKVVEATGLGQNRSRTLIAIAKSKGLIVEE